MSDGTRHCQSRTEKPPEIEESPHAGNVEAFENTRRIYSTAFRRRRKPRFALLEDAVAYVLGIQEDE